MNIDMIGIDHNLAGVHIREKVALTKSQVVNKLKRIKDYYKLKGVVIISTCSRTEIWLSDYNDSTNIYKMVCNVFEIDEIEYRNYFTTRHGEDAACHLFELSCGLKSRIIGEDQILTQVRESADIAREAKTIDFVLEKLFQTGVTAGKKVKTNVRLTPVNNSVGTKTTKLLKEIYKEKKDLKCLVIGNGEIGRITANSLVDEGFDVYMTVRQYKKGEVIIPSGCKSIKYEDRLEYVNLDVIISGTLSPHYTLDFNNVKNYIDGRERIFIDLAMPRDIDPRIGYLKGVSLYDIDSLGVDSKGDTLEHSISIARDILGKYIRDFKDYYYLKDIKRKIYKSNKKVDVSV